MSRGSTAAGVQRPSTPMGGHLPVSKGLMMSTRGYYRLSRRVASFVIPAGRFDKAYGRVNPIGEAFKTKRQGSVDLLGVTSSPILKETSGIRLGSDAVPSAVHRSCTSRAAKTSSLAMQQAESSSCNFCSNIHWYAVEMSARDSLMCYCSQGCAGRSRSKTTCVVQAVSSSTVLQRSGRQTAATASP